MMAKPTVLGPLAAAALTVSCTDAGINVIPQAEPPPVDNLATIEGTYCLSPSEDTTFPLKLLFITDTSGSMQFTDASQGRVTAVESVLQQFPTGGPVYASVLRFNESTEARPASFSNDMTQVDTSILSNADGLTNFQGALALAYSLLSNDMAAAGPAELARTRYVVIFMTDGNPDPVCTEGCPPPASNGDPQVGGDEIYPFCDTGMSADETITLQGGSSCDSAGYDQFCWWDFEPCEDYNQDYQILQKVQQIKDLADTFGAGDLRFHTAQLCDPNTIDAAIQLLGIDCAAGEQLLRNMADIGEGTYRNFFDGESIDYLSFDLRPIFLDYAMRSFVALNRSALPVEGGFEADTDGDGLSDLEELAFCDSAGGGCLDPLVTDTDGDGYGDLFEVRRQASGYDALDFAVPGNCGDSFDEDGDNLTDCEENKIGSSRTTGDTDGDGLPDSLEWILGTNVTGLDDRGDLDNDGVPNGDEVRFRMDPIFRDDANRRSDFGYRYSIRDYEDPIGGGTCIDFEVSNVSLVETLQRGNRGTVGHNDLQVWISEGLAGTPGELSQWREARGCIQYVSPDFKNPADGAVKLTPTDFGNLYDVAGECPDALP